MPYSVLRLAELGGINAKGHEQLFLTKKEDDKWFTGIGFKPINNNNN
jgi:N-acetylglutamate synthase-like GNAT family acetyltransferase